ncbi:MAG: AI-2E family transporter [Cyanobacteria bacterium SID2]|nr:AI-2E family transporter [Cyanobacteria bacterium SID2]MBP0005636.1 AI-2E family transporter [Cyanobacteria bacterium SBC]
MALVLSLIIIWEIRQILLMTIAAIVIATSLNLFARWLQRFGMRRPIAVVCAVSATISVLTIFFWLIVPPFVDQFEQFTQLFPKTLAQLDVWIVRLIARFPIQFFDPSTLDLNALIDRLQPIFNNFIETSFNVFSGTLGVALNIIIVIVLTLMFLANPRSYRNAFILLFPAFYRRRIDDVLDRCEESLSGWLVGILFNMVAIAMMSWLSLWLVLKIPLALAHGIFAGLLTFIPNIGPALSVIPPMATAVLENPWKPIAVLILYIIIQQIEGNILTPYVMARQVSLLPAVTLISQIVFATFFGFLGLLLALPITVIGQVFLQELIIKDILDSWQQGGEPLPIHRSTSQPSSEKVDRSQESPLE